MPHERDPNTIGPLPPNAAVDLYNRTAWIPGEEWQFFIPKERIRLSGVPREAIRYDYSVANVQRSTTVREITNDIGKWLLGSTTDVATVTSACSVELVFAPGSDEQSKRTLPQNSTVEATDLFNRMPDIFIVTIPQGGNSGGSLNLGQALNHASQGAANRNTGLAPAHLQMANSLIKNVLITQPLSFS